jgi:outer membrane protein TolC
MQIKRSCKIIILLIFFITAVRQQYGISAETAGETGYEEKACLTREQAIDELLSRIEGVSFLSKTHKPEESGAIKTLGLTLREVVTLALKNNLDITLKTYDPLIDKELIINQEAVFDPTVSYEGSTGRSQSITALSLVPVHDEARSSKIGLTQKLITGADYALQFESVRAHTDSSAATLKKSYTSSLNLTVTQPLLKDAGIDINKASIYIARNNRDVSISELKEKVIDTVSAVQTAYWNLVFSIEDLKVKEINLQNARDLLEMNRVKIDSGEMAPLEIIQAEASVASREEDVIVAKDTIEDRGDTLKQLINLMKGSEYWNMSIIPVDRPSFKIVSVGLEESLKTAFLNRHDYIQQKISLDTRDIRIKTAKNQLLPTLDLKGSYELNGISEGFSDSMDQVGAGDFNEWLVTLEASFPLGNRDAESTYLRRKLEKAKALNSLKKLEQTIIVEVRSAVRQLDTDIKRVKAAETTKKLQESKLKAEEEKFKAGLSTNFNVLTYQEDLMLAQTGYLEAIIDYNKSIFELAKATGILLEDSNIIFETNKD